MKHPKRIELVGTVKNVNVQRCDRTRRVKISVETEDLHKGFRRRFPVTVLERDNNRLDLLTVGTTIRVVGKIRVLNQTTACRAEKTFRDVVASQVEIIDTK